MVGIAQLVRALDCDSRGWGFKSPYSPLSKARKTKFLRAFFMFNCQASLPNLPIRFDFRRNRLCLVHDAINVHGGEASNSVDNY